MRWRPKKSVRCLKCGWTGSRAIVSRKCPKCGHWHPRLTSELPPRPHNPRIGRSDLGRAIQKERLADDALNRGLQRRQAFAELVRDVLVETRNSAITCDDWPLLGLVALKAKWPDAGKTVAQRRVISKLSLHPGPFTKGYTRLIGGRRVLVFRLLPV